jgi:catechol 2,3-dioxygenase-like lactoylglutathione lyase family enzyme
MRLRQVALVARDLERTVADLRAVLGLEIGFRDPGVALFGLTNAVLPIGDTFLEVVSPAKPDASAARLLARRGGDCGYMVIVQVGALSTARERIEREKIRIVFEHAHAAGHTETIHLHPRDTGAAILSLDASDPPESWDWAGPTWQQSVRADVVAGIAGATLASDDPAALAARWAAILDQPAAALGGEVFAIALDGALLRFVRTGAGGEGLVGVDLVEASRAARARAFDAAKARGLRVDGDHFWIAGTAIRLVDAPTP